MGGGGGGGEEEETITLKILYLLLSEKISQIERTQSIEKKNKTVLFNCNC